MLRESLLLLLLLPLARASAEQQVHVVKVDYPVRMASLNGSDRSPSLLNGRCCRLKPVFSLCPQRYFYVANGFPYAMMVDWSGLQWNRGQPPAVAFRAGSTHPHPYGYDGLPDRPALDAIAALKEQQVDGGSPEALLSSLSETIEASVQSRQSSNFLALVSNVLQRYGAAVSSVSWLMESYVSSVSSARLTSVSSFTEGVSTISSLLSDVRSKSSVASVSSAAMASAAASAVSLRRLSARLLRESLAASYRYDRIEEWSTANSVLYEAVSTSYSSVSASASLAASSLSAALSDYASVMSDIESSRSSTVSSLVSHLFHGSLFAAGRSAQGASLPFIEATRLSAP